MYGFNTIAGCPGLPHAQDINQGHFGILPGTFRALPGTFRVDAKTMNLPLFSHGKLRKKNHISHLKNLKNHVLIMLSNTRQILNSYIT